MNYWMLCLRYIEEKLINQIKSANFMALEADKTKDMANQQQIVFIIRYVFNSEVFDIFWAFIKPEGYTADILANPFTEQLQLILNRPGDNLKLIA